MCISFILLCPLANKAAVLTITDRQLSQINCSKYTQMVQLFGGINQTTVNIQPGLNWALLIRYLVVEKGINGERGMIPYAS